MKRLRLTLIDIMAAIGSTSVALAAIHWATPGRGGPALIVVGPLLGILWDRGRSGRGILGGLLGGAAFASVCLIIFFTGPHGSGSASPSTVANWPPQLGLMTLTCVGFGTLMGIIAWMAASLTGWVFPPSASGPPVVLSSPQPQRQA